MVVLNTKLGLFLCMRAVKSAKQNYTPSREILSLLDRFRRMVNDCICIGLAEKVTSMKALSKKAYHELARYDVPTYYRLTAVSKAAGILRNYRHALRRNPRTKKPYASRLMLTDCYGFRIIGGELRLPIRTREYAYILLNGYVLRSVEGHTVRSVSLTACNLSIAFSKEVAQIEPAGVIEIDRNLDNVTIADSRGVIRRYDLSRATDIGENCRQVKRGFKRSDYRIRKKVYSKYGEIQRNKVGWIVHNASARIVSQAKEGRLGIVMENLKELRKLYRRGNGQGRDYRARMNGWSFAEFQRQVEYKARWEGLPVYYVRPSRMSSACAICGSQVTECAGRKVCCPHCGRLTDRDENAALNIVGAGLRFGLKGVAGEAVKGNPKRGKAIPGAETTKLSPQPKR
jgi:putative transposase